MMYIVALKKNPKTGKIEEVREIPTLDRPDIEMQLPVEQIIKHLTEGKIKYATAIEMNGKMQKGDDLVVVDGHLKTVGNDTVLDNLDNLPLFD